MHVNALKFQVHRDNDKPQSHVLESGTEHQSLATTNSHYYRLWQKSSPLELFLQFSQQWLQI